MTSTYLKAIMVAILLTLLNACEEDAIVSNCDAITILSSDRYENGSSSHFTIISAKIIEDCLEVEFSSSGCDGESWFEELVDAEVILESFPIQRNLRMLLTNEEVCDAVITKTVSFDLTSIQTEDYTQIRLNIEGLEESILYDYGQ